MKRTIVTAGILGMLVLLTIYLNINAEELPKDVRPEEGFLAPEFTLTDLEGNRIRLNELRDKPVFINFWASWCYPCRIEMPHIQAAYEKYQDTIYFVMVNVWDKPDTRKKYLEEGAFTFPIYVDEGESVVNDFRVISIPTTFFINKDGVIKKKIIGTMDPETLEKSLKKIIKD